jgi:16S rRNA (guanine(966)-N(2))-methyltransferase RsmD
MAALRIPCVAIPGALLLARPRIYADVLSQRRVRASAGRGGRGGGSRGGGGGGGGRGRGGSRNKQDSGSTETISEDVEVFNINTGWNIDALSASDASDLLDSFEGGWSVESFEEDNEEDFSDEEDDDDDEAFESVEAFLQAGSDDEEDDVILPSSKKADKKLKKAAGGGTKAEKDLLASLPDHMVKRLNELQNEADEEASRLNPNTQRKAAARQKTHRRLKIVSGYAAGIRILSPQGDQTRPMMEMVRGAVFSMIASLHNCPGGMPEGTRWLDLFAGTGAVGIEALSRGCSEAHFVELSPWVVSNCLQPNLEKCGVEGESIVHTTRAEDFLKRAATVPRFAGGAFDFISVCPPYEAVSYTELYDLLEESPLIHDTSIIVVEYPKKVIHEIRDRIGPLVKLRDRKYGRTYIALYASGEDDEEYDSDDE